MSKARRDWLCGGVKCCCRRARVALWLACMAALKRAAFWDERSVPFVAFAAFKRAAFGEVRSAPVAFAALKRAAFGEVRSVLFWAFTEVGGWLEFGKFGWLASPKGNG